MNRFSRMKSVFLQDINWKIFSVAVAIVLWIIVINVENPIETRKYSVPLTIKNENYITDQGLHIIDLDEISGMYVTLTIRGERNSLDTLTKLRQSISAYVNLTKCTMDLSAGTVTCYVENSLPIYSSDSLEIVSQSVMNVVFHVEEDAAREIPVEIVFEEGSADRYLMERLAAEPSSVVVSGPVSAVNAVNKLCVYFDGIDSEENASKKIYAYDSRGEAVEGIILSSSDAAILIPDKEKVGIDFEVDYIGELRGGYVVTSIDINSSDKDFFSYGGELKEVIIKLPDISVAGKYESFTTLFDVTEFLPEGVELSADSAKELEVTVNISKIEEQEYFINVSEIDVNGLEDGYMIEFNGDKVTAFINGAEEELNVLDESEINLELHIENCTEGSFIGYAEAKIPEGSTLKGGAEVKYRIFYE